ncbi:hypothetical protein QYE76_004551 [Lolium multiflorum]|uniref:PGG domain-containing protein n=1 Tax=Lolium multiflorum TaxID=4521 RepID=A0AAD8RUW1_LOLMU|nr:hypothetical protein QYE76_004551 [Lolium multiflorum]
MESINTEQQNPACEDASAPLPPTPAAMDSRLLMAASMGDSEALKTLVNWGDAPVWPKAVSPQIVVEAPIDRGALIDPSITNGSLDVQPQTAAGAVEEGDGHQPSAELLLEGVTTLGDTVLHVLAKSGYSSRENFLDSVYVVYNKAKHLLEKPNNLGDTPLHCAARSGSWNMVYCLLELAKGDEGGIDRVKSVLRKQNMRGETALHDAIRGRNNNIVVLLLIEDSQLARVPSEGMSPLYLAVVLGQYHTAIILHEKDNQLSYSGPNGENVLHVSVLVSIEMSEILLGWNKELAKKQCNNGSTPLHLHLSRADCMVPVLLESDLSAAYQPNGSGSFPIHIAASKGQLKGVISLLEKCPDCVKLCDNMGRTFLHVAVENKSYNVVSYACKIPLLASILNTQDNNGNTMLHLAVQVGDLRMVCSLLRELQVRLSIPNYSGRTPLDLSWCNIPWGVFYNGNPQVIIDRSLRFAGARHGCYGARLEAISQLDNDRESAIIKDSTQTLGIGSVLIATVAFSATFALPGGYRADDHPNGGTPTLAGRYAFDAFIMATTLAFVCASAATTSLVVSGMTVVDLAIREKHFHLSVFFARSSVTSLAASFAFGLYMVLAPVAHRTAVAVLVVTFSVMAIAIIEALDTLKIIGALRHRLRKRIWLVVARLIVMVVFTACWPFIIIFGWPAYSVKYRQN